jgi:hypothetical protein
MAEAAYTMLSACLTASVWALAGGVGWMLIFYCAIPIAAKWNAFGLLSNEAAARAATLRALGQARPAAEPVRYWG